MKKVLSFSAVILLMAFGCSTEDPEIVPEVQLKAYQSGSCSSGSFSVNFSGSSFVTGIGWQTGSGRNITFSGSCSNCDWGPGVYGWWRNPLVEYYVGKSGGSNRGSYTCNGSNYTLYVDRRINQPSIDGTQSFDQYNASGARTGTIDMNCHFNAWRNLGAVGNQAYQVVMVESWSGRSGNASVSVPGSSWYTHWTGSGSATFTCGGGGGGGGGGSSKTIVVRARGTNGSESIQLQVNNSTIQTWTLGTSMQNYTATTTASGGINVRFTNDASGRDVQVDYIQVNGSTRQAESQSTNTGVYQNSQCGGSNSEWMHCNGFIGFGNTP